MRALRAARLVGGAVAVVALFGAFSARAATNVVPESFLGAGSLPITANDLKPPECAAIFVTSVIPASEASGSSAYALVLGTPGEDEVRTGGQPTCVVVGAGDDEVRGGGGDDVFLGGPGDDELRGEGGNDHLYGGDGDDRLRGDGGGDFLYGGAGNDRVEGDGGTDFCDGGTGTDAPNSCETAVNIP